MKIQHNGETYHLLFKHMDNRFQPVVNETTGEVIGRRPATKREMRKFGLATTICTLMRETGKDEKGYWVGEQLAQATTRLNPEDHFNKAHGRWYALEKVLDTLLHTSKLNGPLVRALRKGYYNHVAWRPDGRDGFTIRDNGFGRKELVKETVWR